MTEEFQRILAEIEKLAPVITARIPEIEAARDIPPDLVDKLRSIGIFRLYVPRSHGGLELELPEPLQIIRALARIDGSIGWTAMIGAGAALLSTLHEREVYEQIYRNGPDVIFAGSGVPVGTAEERSDGWLVNGRWPFASGCRHADRIFGACIMTKDGESLPGQIEGMPLVRLVSLPAREYGIEDTWHATGLKGTGSHHVTLKEKLASAANFVDLMGGASCVTGPLYVSPLHNISLMHDTVVLGIAEGALDELVAMANAGRRQQRAATAMRDSEIFRNELGRIEADLRAAQALHEVQTASHWRHALNGTLKDDALLLEATQSSIWIAATCRRVVDDCFALAGGSAVYDNSPLQRRWRDVHVAAQHAAVHPWQNAGAGAALLARGSGRVPAGSAGR
jgi:indole-3-acetate monooxygenase